MAKHKDDEKSPKDVEADAHPAGDEPAGVKGGKGTPVYPPPTSDRSGERTTNVPPAKQLPAKAPEEEGGADEVTRLKAENAALATVVRNLGGNPDEVSKTAAAKLGAVRAAADTSKPAWEVTGAGETEPVTVHADDEAGAVEAFKAKRGVWHLGAQPAVKKAGK